MFWQRGAVGGRYFRKCVLHFLFILSRLNQLSALRRHLSLLPPPEPRASGPPLHLFVPFVPLARFRAFPKHISVPCGFHSLHGNSRYPCIANPRRTHLSTSWAKGYQCTGLGSLR
ncbi:hypothetical protein BDR22DRAFT_624891 [Usnea florida]